MDPAPEAGADSSALPAELVAGVARAAPTLADRAGVRAVCHAWRRALDTPAAWADLGLPPRAYLPRVCGRGDLEAAAWLADTFSLTLADALWGGRAFRAEAGVRWLVARWSRHEGLICPPPYADSALGGAAYALHGAVAAGNLPYARWLGSTFDLASACDSHGSPLLACACRHGHLDVARWVADTYLGPDGVLTDAMRGACGGGHLEVAQWVLEVRSGRHEPNAEADIAFAKQALHSACVGGHLGVAQWVVAALWPEQHAALAKFAQQSLLGDVGMTEYLPIYQWLVGVVGAGGAEISDGMSTHVKVSSGVAQWIAATYPVAALDGRCVSVLLHAACRGGAADLAIHLVTEHKYFQWDPMFVVVACREGHFATAAALCGTCGLTPAALSPRALPVCCDRGQLAAMQWLIGFGAEIDTVWPELFLSACRWGRVEILAWLLTVRPAGLPPLVADALVEHFTDGASMGAGWPAVRWLAATFGWPADATVAPRCWSSALKHACRTGDVGPAQWLATLPEFAAAVAAIDRPELAALARAAWRKGHLGAAHWAAATFGLELGDVDAAPEIRVVGGLIVDAGDPDLADFR